MSNKADPEQQDEESILSSTRSSADSEFSNEYLPETLLEGSQNQQRIRSRRYSSSSRVSNLSRVSTNFSRITSLAESVRDDNRQTEEEERRQLSSDAGVLRREWTINDALSQLETKPVTDEEQTLQDLNEEQEKNKNMGYTTEDLLDPPPDGGVKAWTCAVCVGLLSFSTWGINSSYGVFLSYYESTDYFPEATTYDFALIGSLVVGISQILSPLVIIMMKVVGYKQTLIIGTILQTGAYISASFATKIWHLYLTQGVLTGISFALVFCPATMIIPTWFLHKRGLANGISLCGSGLGGVVFSQSINRVIEETGNQKWALRMLAIVGFCVCTFSIILTNPRNYKKPKTNMKTLKTVSKAIFDMSAWKEPSTIIIAIWFGIANMSYTIVLFSISSYAVAVGLTQKQASTLTSLLNAGQTIGRPLIGLFADKVGRINFCIGGISIMVVMIFAFWINARSYATLIVFSILTGFVLPIANTLNQPLMADAIEPSRFPAAFSLVFMVLSIFAFPCEVIGMKLRSPNNHRFPYLYCQIFTGLLYFCSVLILFPLRQIKIKKMVINRKETTNLRIDKLKQGKISELSEEEAEEEIEILERRLENYDKLLTPTLKGYISRTLYPIKA